MIGVLAWSSNESHQTQLLRCHLESGLTISFGNLDGEVNANVADSEVAIVTRQ